MTPEERTKVARLARCTMSPGTWDRRFTRDLAARPERYVLSAKQAAMVDRLTVRYRRQLAELPPPPG